MKQKQERMQKLWNKYKYALLVVLLGVGMLMWSGQEPTAEQDSRTEEISGGDAAALQRELEDILSTISGAGQVRVLLTLESDGERQLAQDTELSYSGQTAAPEDYSRTSETVLVDGGNGDETVVTRRLYPTYRGALVVCQGGDRADVQLAIVQAVSVLTGLSSDRVAVAKWQ